MIKALFSKGILYLHILKTEEKKTKAIKVAVEQREISDANLINEIHSLPRRCKSFQRMIIQACVYDFNRESHLDK